jgi:hypothetical protein
VGCGDVRAEIDFRPEDGGELLLEALVFFAEEVIGFEVVAHVGEDTGSGQNVKS